MKPLSFNFLILGLSFLQLALQAQPSYAQLSPAVYRRLNAEIFSAHLSGKTATAVFDLDETLIHSTHRRVAAYQLAIQDLESAPLPKEWGPDLAQLKNQVNKLGAELFRSLENEYSDQELFIKLGLSLNNGLLQKISKLMLEHYLGNGKLLQLDRPIYGAVQFVKWLQAKNVYVFFVSSRYTDTQLVGTVESLTRLGMYFPNYSQIILRNRSESSIDFKSRAFNEISKSPNYRVVLAAENEPENMVAMETSFPSSIKLFVTGAAAHPQVPLPSKILTLKHFGEQQIDP